MKKVDIAHELSARLNGLFRVIYVGEENVNEIERHGIKDKGGTFIHQFMFLKKNN